jgi:hypothetical protein
MAKIPPKIAPFIMTSSKKKDLSLKAYLLGISCQEVPLIMCLP